MSKDTKDLKAAFEDAEARAQKIMADKDEAIQKARERFDDKLRKATDEAAKAQKAWLDAEAADALRDRPDGEAVAASLGLKID